MMNLLVFKEQLKRIYGKYAIYIEPAVKFLIAVLTFYMINHNIGSMEVLKNPFVVFVLALICAFLPRSITVFFATCMIGIHLFFISLEAAIIIISIMLIMFLLYFHFTPKNAFTVLLTPLAFALQIPYAIPITMGLVGTPLSAIPVTCGTIIYFLIISVKKDIAFIGKNSTETMLRKYTYILDSIFNNKVMFLFLITFLAAIVVVYVIRRLSVDHAWTIAIIAGVLTIILIILTGDFLFGITYSIVPLLLGLVASTAIAFIFQFFVFSIDYTRTEYVQFEDDEYYYYIKAIPKMIVTTPDKKVQKINPQKTPMKRTTLSPTEEIDLEKQMDDID